MNIILEKNILEKLLINTQAFLEKKDFSQITSHIHLEVKENKLTVKATDYEIGIILNTQELEIQKEGQATANGKKILEIVKHLRDQKIEIKTKDSELNIKQGNAEFKIPMFTPEEFPSFPDIKTSKSLDINKKNLSKALKQALSSVDTNNPKYELNGMLLNFLGDHYDVVSTDTKRLSIISSNENIKKEAHIIISKKSSIEIQKIIHQESEIFFDKTNLIINNQNILFFSKLINSSYPEYQKIVPSSINHQVVLKRKEIFETLQMIASLSQAVCFYFSGSSLTLTTSEQSQSSAKIEVEIKSQIDSFTLHVNIRYLLDFLLAIDEETFLIELNEEKLPFVISSNNYKQIIMPIIK